MDLPLRIVPIAWFGASINSSESLESGRIVCWPGAPTSVASPQSLPVSPLDLYVVEKVGKLIDEWMLRQLLHGHGRKLGPLPTPSKKLTEAWPEQFESIPPAHVRLLAPVDAQKAAELKASLRGSANSQVEDAVGVAIEQVAALAQLCGHHGSIRARAAARLLLPMRDLPDDLVAQDNREEATLLYATERCIFHTGGGRLCLVWQGLARIRLGFGRGNRPSLHHHYVVSLASDNCRSDWKG